MSKKGKIIVVSAPSGAGKTTIVRQILQDFPEIVFSISATTRPKRDNETDGREYFFISEEVFKQKIVDDAFVEWGKFYDYYYGTFKSFLSDTISSGKNILLEVDVIGAIAIKKLFEEAVLIYILPPSIEELEKRLLSRKTESEEDFKKRIERANLELSKKDEFDFIVENSILEDAVDKAKKLINKIVEKE